MYIDTCSENIANKTSNIHFKSSQLDSYVCHYETLTTSQLEIWKSLDYFVFDHNETEYKLRWLPKLEIHTCTCTWGFSIPYEFLITIMSMQAHRDFTWWQTVVYYHYFLQYYIVCTSYLFWESYFQSFISFVLWILWMVILSAFNSMYENQSYKIQYWLLLHRQ